MTALQAYGAAGVVKIVRILEREITMGMRLMGAASVADLKPNMASRAVPCHSRLLILYIGRARGLAASSSIETLAGLLYGFSPSMAVGECSDRLLHGRDAWDGSWYLL